MMNQGRIALVLALVGMMVVAGNILAQAEDRGNPVQFSVAAEVEGTDNRDSDTSEKTNFDIFIKPKLDIISDTERTIFDFYYEPAYRYRTDPHPTQNDSQFQHNVGLKIKHQLGAASRVRLSERYAFTDDPAVQQGGTTLRRDSSFSLNNISAGIAVDMGEKVMLDVAAENMFKAYDETVVAHQSDEDMTSASLKLVRFLQPQLGVYGSVSVAQYGYDQTGNVDRGFDTTAIGVGMDRVLSDYVRTSLQAGSTMVSYDDETISSDSSPYVGVIVQLQPTSLLRVLLSGNYSLQNSDVYPFSSQEASSFMTKVEWTGLERMKISAWGNYRVSKYDAANVPTSLLVAEGVATVAQYMSALGWKTDGNETAIGLGVELAYSVAENTVLKLMQIMEDVDSDVSTSFTRNATRVGISRTF